MTDETKHNHLKLKRVVFEACAPSPNVYKHKVWAEFSLHRHEAKFVKAEWLPMDELLVNAAGERPYGFFPGRYAEEAGSLPSLFVHPEHEFTVWIGVDKMAGEIAMGHLQLTTDKGEQLKVFMAVKF